MKKIFLLLGGAVLLFSMNANAQSNSNWMSGLNGNLYISQLSIPGAHDAATGEGFSGTSAIGALVSGKCQSVGLAAQWDAGVRCFDLRPTDANNCPINHGSLQTKINLTNALNTITGRLQTYPNEFAIILMRNENDNGSTDDWKTRVSTILNNFSSYVIPFSHNLRLQDVRGKVVVLSRDAISDGYNLGAWPDNTTRGVVWANGNDAFRFVVQDYYQVTDANSKKNAIKDLLAEARSQTSPNFIFINHTSGYSGSTGTNGNISSNAKTMNKYALDEINANPGRTGIILMDFAATNSDNYYGIDLCNAIIAQNNLLSGLNLSTLPDNTDYYLQNVQTGLWLQGNTAKTTTSRDGWNTAANMGSYGRPFRLQNYGADGYTLNTQSGPNALGCNYGDANLLYLDSSIGPTRWKITGKKDNAYITINWDRWLSVDNNRLVNSNSASTWKIWTRQERIDAMASATRNAPQDVTWLLVNPELMNNDNRSGQWTVSRTNGNQGWQDGFRPNRVFETWSFSNLDFYQTVSNVPNGLYEVRAHAVYSPTGINTTSLEAYNEYVSRGDATVFAALYANDSEVKLPSIYSFTNGTKVADYTNRNLGTGVNIVDGWWQIARAMGEDDKFYTEPLRVVVTDGKLRIGIKSLSGNPSSNWVVIGSFSLSYLGQAMTIDEDKNYTATNASNATIQLHRTLSTSYWNSFCVPFNINNADLKAQFGSQVEVATYSETANGQNSTVSFNKMQTPSVTANKPVLLKPSAISNNNKYLFTGNVVSGDAKVTGTNFNFVGTFAASTTIPAGDYFLNNNTLYKSEGLTTIAGTYAYIKARSNEARVVKVIIDGEDVTTGIVDVNREAITNNRYYDLQGRPMVNGTLTPGLYIVNGRMVVIK